MTLVLHVDTSAWTHHIDQLASRVEGLIPVVKGNGYGFGSAELIRRASGHSVLVAVGTEHELVAVPDDLAAVVLSPTLTPSERPRTVHTIGNEAHLDVLARTGGNAVVKIRSSMNRHGVPADRAAELVNRCRDRGVEVVALSIHPPLAGTSADHRAEIERLLDIHDSRGGDSSLGVWVSHVEPSDYDALRAAHPGREWRLRLGTALWHGDKSMLALRADVLETIAVRSGDVAGYRATTVPFDGTLIMIGCGSAHGVAPLADGASPFHFARHRLPLLEPPHMHTSMCLVPADRPVPAIGEEVDVQRPLVVTRPDRIEWE